MKKNQSHTVEIWRVFPTGETRKIHDEVLRETSLTLEVDGKPEASATITPGDETLWALGNLRSRRKILTMDDVRDIRQTPGRISVDRFVTRPGLPEPGRFLSIDSKEAAPQKRIHNFELTPLPVTWTTDPETLHKALEMLNRAPLFRRTGAVHVAVLATPDGEILRMAEDIGRHNAVDKAIGWAVSRGVDLSHTFMAISGRLPGDMVYKAVGAGIPLLASVSAATATGIETARTAGITLIGFAREGRMNVYTHPKRIQ